jgi:hypothetical protein
MRTIHAPRKELRDCLEFAAKVSLQLECCEQQLEQVRRTAANERAVLEQRIADLQRLLDTGP